LPITDAPAAQVFHWEYVGDVRIDGNMGLHCRRITTGAQSAGMPAPPSIAVDRHRLAISPIPCFLL
jgi:hypothetical protein